MSKGYNPRYRGKGKKSNTDQPTRQRKSKKKKKKKNSGGYYSGGSWHGGGYTSYSTSIAPKEVIYVEGKGSIWGASGSGLNLSEIMDFDIFVPLAGLAYDKLEPKHIGDEFFFFNGEVMAWPMKDFSTWPDSLVKSRAEVLVQKMREGKKILVACQGGKGRTGLLLGACAIVAGIEKMKKDPVEALRSFYHESAVETTGQENVLRRMVGLDEIPETKTYVYSSSGGSSYQGGFNSHGALRINQFPGTSQHEKGGWVRVIGGMKIPEEVLLKALDMTGDPKTALELVMEKIEEMTGKTAKSATTKTTTPLSTSTKKSEPEDVSGYLNPEDRIDPWD